MNNLNVFSENCNTWNNKNFEDTSDLGLECTSCSSYGKFSFVHKYFIWRWEIYIPYDWKLGEWSRVRLRPTLVPVLILKCISCGEIFRVYPSFIIKGTTLTLSALIFIAFVYESTKLTWRDIPELFCDEHNKIAHSTLYKAVHGFGKSLQDYEDIINKGKTELINKYPSTSEENVKKSVWPPQKSRKENTLQREVALRIFLSPFSILISEKGSFPLLFYTYVRKFRTILSSLSPPVKKLYRK
jgi:hypothetical protein